MDSCVGRDFQGCHSKHSNLENCETFPICQGKGSIKVLAAGLKDCTRKDETNSDSMVLQVIYMEKRDILLGDFEDTNKKPVPNLNSPYGILMDCTDVSSDLIK